MRYQDLPTHLLDAAQVPYLALTPRFAAPGEFRLAGRTVRTRTSFHYRYSDPTDGPEGYDTTWSSEVKLAEIIAAFLAQGGRLGQLARCHRQVYKVWKTGRGRGRQRRRTRRGQ